MVLVVTFGRIFRGSVGRVVHPRCFTETTGTKNKFQIIDCFFWGGGSGSLEEASRIKNKPHRPES